MRPSTAVISWEDKPWTQCCNYTKKLQSYKRTFFGAAVPLDSEATTEDCWVIDIAILCAAATGTSDITSLHVKADGPRVRRCQLYRIATLILGLGYVPHRYDLNLIDNPSTVIQIGAALYGICVLYTLLKGPCNPSLPSRLALLLRFGVGTVVGTCAAYVGALFFGAPYTEQVEETLHFSLLLAVLAVAPAVCVLGFDRASYSRLFLDSGKAASLAEVAVVMPALGAVLGAWLGAAVIPLDWDRPWQVWPISCVFGMVAGHAFGLANVVVTVSWRMHKAAKEKTS
eukprot:jgi/Mesvir1/25794/Mv06772-RA.1